MESLAARDLPCGRTMNKRRMVKYTDRARALTNQGEDRSRAQSMREEIERTNHDVYSEGGDTLFPHKFQRGFVPRRVCHAVHTQR